MKAYWQEILTFVIVGIAVYLLLKRYFFSKRKRKGVGAAACDPCSTGSCEGCAVLDLSQEIAHKKGTGDATGSEAKNTDFEQIDNGKSDDMVESSSKLNPKDMDGGETTEPLCDPENDPENDPGEGEAPPMKKDYLTQCLDGCIQARKMGLK